MAPKKKEVQKLSYGEFMQDSSFGGSWADEVEETYISGTQPLPPSERRSATGYGSGYGGGDRGYSVRESFPQRIPDKPPFTAHLGNLSYDATVESVTEFFEGCNITNVRIIEDREQNRPKGFAYAEFADADGLKKALTFDGQSFQGRNIRIKIADPPKDRGDRGESTRDLSDWTRKGPLADLPTRGNDRERRGPSDFGERRPPRDPMPADDGRVRDFNNWERRGPLSPLPQPEAPESRDGSRPRTNDGSRPDTFRSNNTGNRRASPAAWGEGRQQQPTPPQQQQQGQQEGSRPPRREFSDRPERVPSAAELDTQWRKNMRPDSAAKSPEQSREGSEAPPSPAGQPALLATRPKLNLTKRTVSESADISPALPSTDSKASPFGAARPIDTAAREREIEEKKQVLLKEKKEAEEKAKEERRIAKEAAAKEAAEKAAAEATDAADAKDAEEEAEEEESAEAQEDPNGPQATKEEQNGSNAEQKIPARPRDRRDSKDIREGREPREPREPREKGENAPNLKSRAVESGNWRQASGEQKGPGRGGHIPSGPRRGGGGPPRGPRGDREGRPPRANGAGPAAVHQPQPPQPAAAGDATPSTPTPDDDGWTTVPNKNRRGQSTRPLAS